ncbi:hypothetical protein [Erythrobacter sp.]|uniref:hypothetical protein n=1 Tax=Erythrobacter sp. TaxID=1042 RepID=UPI0025F9D16C|nr:hypothetical protein [Erythrobacter sp.]
MMILLAVLGLPYGYLALYWGGCLIGGCRFDGHMLFYSFVALVAAPFVVAMIGGGAMMGGLRRMRQPAASGTLAPGAIMDRARGGLRFWLGLVMLIGALPTCAALFYLMLYTPKEGRDSLGRICETEGSATTCRPDPEADRPSELDRINAARKRQRWFEKD